jgi:catechol 2,3-dioxygenase-like lactoylglutathione lyase family enzyme
MVVFNSFPDLCVGDVRAAATFYRSLLSLDVVVDHGWYVELGLGDRVLLALVQAGHETVPAPVGSPARGLLVSFEVDDAGVCADAAARMGCAFVVDLVAELGQRHFMVCDPDGAVVDVIQRVALTKPDRVRLAAYRRRAMA